jgi:hypothetical protein
MAIDPNINSNINTQRAFQNDITADRNSADNMSPTNADDNSLLQTSTNIRIFSSGIEVGMVQSFTVNESRNINKLQAIGVEGVAQAVPSNTNGGSLNISRIALYESNIWAAFGMISDRSGSPINGNKVFKTLKDQRIPFEVRVETRKSNTEYYVETYIDCWLASYSKSYTVQTITVAETATIQYADVY